VSDVVIPHSFSDAAAALAAAARAGRPVRIVGGGSKLGWGAAVLQGALQLQMAHLSRVTIHDDGVSATVNAGTPLIRAQATFARAGMMLAIDPQLGLGRSPSATVGGVVACGDSGPLCHRHGPPRDQILGVTVALSDGSIVRTGPRTDHAQDGLAIAGLFTGSFGTLGAILAVDVRLRPFPGATASALATADAPEHLCAATERLTEAHPELAALDFAWRDGRGGLLAQIAGEQTVEQATAITRTMRDAGLADAVVRNDDAGLWARQRAGQRSRDRALLRVLHRPQELASVLYAADAGAATVVGRAALGIAYLTLDPLQIAAVRAALPDTAAAIVLDLPSAARGTVAPWHAPEGPELEFMRTLKARFDPAGICNPGLFVGSI
jgi:glycolate oxidase FAD binding subunit